MLSTKELAEKVGLKPGSVRKITHELSGKGLSERLSSGWIFYESSIEYIKGRPERRGRKRKKTG